MTDNIRSKYNEKLKAGFKAKWAIYLFDCAVKNAMPSEKGFSDLKLSEEKEPIKSYTTRYYQLEYGDEFDDNRTVKQLCAQIEELNQNSKDVEQRCRANYKPLHFDDYSAVVLADNAHCGYCGITQAQVDKLIDEGKIRNKAETRGFSLELDRLRPNEEYTKDNITLACYWCNNAKTDEFSVAEFKPIAEGISAAWEKRGVKINPDFKYPTAK